MKHTLRTVILSLVAFLAAGLGLDEQKIADWLNDAEP